MCIPLEDGPITTVVHHITSNAMSQSEVKAEICNRRPARENMQPVLSAGKLATGAQRGKTRVSHVAIGFSVARDWL